MWYCQKPQVSSLFGSLVQTSSLILQGYSWISVKEKLGWVVCVTHSTHACMFLYISIYIRCMYTIAFTPLQHLSICLQGPPEDTATYVHKRTRKHSAKREPKTHAHTNTKQTAQNRISPLPYSLNAQILLQNSNPKPQLLNPKS